MKSWMMSGLLIMMLVILSSSKSAAQTTMMSMSDEIEVTTESVATDMISDPEVNPSPDPIKRNIQPDDEIEVTTSG